MHILANKNGITATFLSRGATLVELLVPDRNGKFANVVLGFDRAADYESDANQYFGATVGRVANRIARGRFPLPASGAQPEREVQLAVNDGPNHLHGGVLRSFDKVLWKAEPKKMDSGEASLWFSYTSPDGEEGYPGTVQATVIYTLTNDNELRIEYLATTDRPTPINLTHHSFFNLAGAGSDTVLDHTLCVKAEKYTPTDETLIPTGQLATVAGTPLDFRNPRRIRDRFDALTSTAAKGLDHNFVVKDHGHTFVALAAELTEPGSGRVLRVFTDQPGIQVYSGNYLKGQRGREGKIYPQYSAICLETQFFPDAVNQPAFLSPIVNPGQTYRHRCVYEFAVT